MDKRSLVLYLSGLAAAGAVVGLAASCSDQPRIKCTAGHGPFAAIYTAMGANDCGLQSELIGVEAYNYPLPDNSNLDPNRGSLGMEPLDLAHEVDIRAKGTANEDKRDMNPAHKEYSLGDWMSPTPAADNFCTVNSPNDTEQDLGYIPPVFLEDGGLASPASPAQSVKYHWTNVRFYNEPRSPGTQLIADLELTRTLGQTDGGPGTPCTTRYKVVGLWPAVSCEDHDTHMLDETLCYAEPAKGRATGSGISPDLATRCDPVLKHCVLQRDPPSFK